jgi:hypothetical protein
MHESVYLRAIEEGDPAEGLVFGVWREGVIWAAKFYFLLNEVPVSLDLDDVPGLRQLESQ